LDNPDNAKHQRDLIRMIGRTYRRIEQLAPKGGTIDAATEVQCDACNGSGFPSTKQSDATGRRIYPAPCKKCDGKGRLRRT
jgi:DnaJ-class molecular chaperone